MCTRTRSRSSGANYWCRRGRYLVGTARHPDDAGQEINELYTKIGQLTMEREFLEQGLERIHGLRVKK